MGVKKQSYVFTGNIDIGDTDIRDHDNGSGRLMVTDTVLGVVIFIYGLF